MHPSISAAQDTIADLCRRYRISQLDVFGSAARATDFNPDRSDADFLVEFEPDADPGMSGFLDIKEALEQAVGRRVDLVERPAVLQSRNYLRRRQILAEAEPVFVANPYPRPRYPGTS